MELDAGMQAAIAEMRQALTEGGIPIGSSLVRHGEVIAAGHNRRVQDGDPVTHAEIDCLRRAGRSRAGFRGATLYSTLMPCYLCAGAAVQFGIAKVIVGDDRNFPGAPDFLRSHGIEVQVLNVPECVETMARFVVEQPALWNEDIGR